MPFFRNLVNGFRLLNETVRESDESGALSVVNGDGCVSSGLVISVTLEQASARMKEAKVKRGAVKEKAIKMYDKGIKKRKGALGEAKAKKPKPSKKVKDPNAPKRPQTAFFIFLNEFRTTFKEEHPDVKGVAAVGKAGGERWKSMSESDKQPFVTKAAQKRAEYDRSIASYKQKQEDEEEADAEESDKSKSEIEEEEEEEEDLDD